jgi:hypothetical protein
MTFTDTELNTLQAMLLQSDPSRIGYSGPKKYNRDGEAANAAITYLRAQLAERDALGAVVTDKMVADLVRAINALRHAVLGETGFASAIRLVTGLAYPWPALDEADRISAAALAQMETTRNGR